MISIQSIKKSIQTVNDWIILNKDIKSEDLLVKKLLDVCNEYVKYNNHTHDEYGIPTKEHIEKFYLELYSSENGLAWNKTFKGNSRMLLVALQLSVKSIKEYHK